MITNGKLIVLLPKTPLSLNSSDDLSKVIHDCSLRQYFGLSARFTSEEAACDQIKDAGNNLHTIVVAEKGFFATNEERDVFKKKLGELGVSSNHILFGEDYASGYHHLLLTISELCES